MAEHKDHLMQTLRSLEASGHLEGLPKEPAGGFSKNAEAERLFGLRRTDCTAFDQPCELGYHCPVCQYPQVMDGHYDERLHWSEYESFIWCAVCNVDYPSRLCLPISAFRAIGIFLSSVRDAITCAALPKSSAIPKEIGTHKEIPMYRVTVDGIELNVGFRHSDGSPRYTICTISTDDRRLTQGSAKCSAGDQFCRATGRKLALTRAVAKLPKHVRRAIWKGYWWATERRINALLAI